MVKVLLVVWLSVAAAIGLAASLVPSVEVHGGFLDLLGLAIVFGLVNATLGTVIRLLTLPLTVVTFGLSDLVVNGVLLVVTAWSTNVLDVGGFFPAVAAAFLISVLSTVLVLAATRFLSPPPPRPPSLSAKA